MRSLIVLWIWIAWLILLSAPMLPAAERIPITIEQHSIGAPITLGIPFAQGTLQSPDHVRLLDADGAEIPCQVTEVSNWEPVDFSIKWIWVFFFAQAGDQYQLEYGSEIRRKPITGPTIKFKNSQRPRGYADIDTGPLRFRVASGASGFLQSVRFDAEGDGFERGDTIATEIAGRGSFLDLLDDLGIDSSQAVISRTVREKGSGPLHAILRIEGSYLYKREDNNPSPFVIRIHAYAGQSYVRVLHTMTYTGVPDKHQPREGQHAYIAISDTENVLEERESEDEGWMQPNDRISGIGLELKYQMSGQVRFQSGFYSGSWHTPGPAKEFKADLANGSQISIVQSGPKPDRVPPLPNSDGTTRIDGFAGKIRANGIDKQLFERAEGWTDVRDDRWGIAIGIRNFFEEYPKELSLDLADQSMTAYIWSPDAGTWGFQRASLRWDAGMLDNFATGLTKTTELIYHFHAANTENEEIRRTMQYVLDPPAPHASPETYSKSCVYGRFAPYTAEQPGLERNLEYKFAWNMYNQHWEPWYGILDWGDQMQFYFRNDWYIWVNNEPAIDFMHWLQFMRTGDRKYFLNAEAMSRHSMDVDNIHWPAKPKYIGDTNPALDFWKSQNAGPEPTPFLGVGKRHARQHYTGLLSAHVWLTGWLASYYLTGYHRGLDIARLSGDSYLNRIWGDHDLRGRRLYLAVWNLTELWDATKDDRYFQEASERVKIMLDLQNGPDQYGSLIMDRYGYSQPYIALGLSKYYQMTGDQRVKNGLVRHARAVRDNPSWNHDYESFFATIHPLVAGYELSGERSLLDTAIRRSELLNTDKLEQSFDEIGSQQAIAEALLTVSHLPKSTRPGRTANWEITQSMRVYGWTTVYNIPWLLYWMEGGEVPDDYWSRKSK